MAIGRISGAMLSADLDRQGIDLQFTTDSSSLLYLNFSEFLTGINTNQPTETLTVNGTFSAAGIKFNSNAISTVSANTDLSISPTGNIQLGQVTKVKIGGGAADYVLTTDGTGNLAWVDLADLSEKTDVTGMSVILGAPSDASLSTCAAYNRWTANTTVTNAVDDLNRVLLNLAQNTFVGNVNFSANTTMGPSPLTVTFNATVTGNPDQYIWNFGDGTTSTAGQTVTHTYNSELGGLFTVYFQAFNSNGVCGSSLETGGIGSASELNRLEYIKLFTPLPIPEFTIADSDIDSSTSINFTNSSKYATSYTINWGDTTQSNIASNTGPGASGTTISHEYNNTLGDTAYNLVLTATSSSAGLDPVDESRSAVVRVYSTHSPVLLADTTSGNNSHVFYANGAPNVQGLQVNFTNNTASRPGNTSLFGNNLYKWYWGDGTSTAVDIGSVASGDTAQTIDHSYQLTNPTVSQTFTARLEVENGHTQSPFVSSTVSITVYPAPTAQFTAQAVTASDRTGDAAQVGYLFTDLNGLNRANVAYLNTSYNTNLYKFNFGDSVLSSNITDGDPGSPTGSALYHSFSSTGLFSQTLTATGTRSINSSDNTLVRANYIEIKSAPTPPAGLSTKTLTITSVGDSPKLAAAAQDNTLGSAPAAGTSVNRITTASPIESGLLSNVYSSNTGTLTCKVNSADDGAATFTTANNVGTYTSLLITADLDAHAVSPTVYPSNFYQVFTAKVSKTNASVPLGVNSFQLQHSVTGNTNQLIFVKDDLTAVPTIDTSAATMSHVSATSIKYISSVPYYENNGNVKISGLKVYNWIGQTYKDTQAPLVLQAATAAESTVGNIIISQTRAYGELNGAVNYLTSGIPQANTGNTQVNSYSMGDLYTTINGTTAAVAKLKTSIENVNGTSAVVELPNYINVYSTTYTGFDEQVIPVSDSLGVGYTDDGKRIQIELAEGDTPLYVPTLNYYTNYAFAGNIANIGSTDEAVVRWGAVQFNQTNYAAYLPPGPDFSQRTQSAQYIRVAFRRNQVQNFTITYTGKISGMWIAAPGTQIDDTSGLNGWLDCANVYAGSGIPGSITAQGGNGQDYCAFDTSNRVILGQQVTNKSCKVTLGSETSTNATGNQILINIRLVAGDSLTSLSIS